MSDSGSLLDRARNDGRAGRTGAALVSLAIWLVLGRTATFATEIVTFDFERVDPGNGYWLLQLEDAGVHAAIRHENIPFAVNLRTEAPRFDATFGVRALSVFNHAGGTLNPGAFLVDFSKPVSSVSVDMGDFGEDDDWLQLAAYAGPLGTGPLVADQSTLLVGGGHDFSFATLAVRAPSIRSMVMIGGSPIFPNSVFYDNIRVTVVPEPDSWRTICLGLVCLTGWIAYKKSRRRVDETRRLL